MQETDKIFMEPEAIEQALVFKSRNPQWEQLSLRVYMAGKGCDGFDYGVSFDESAPDDLRWNYAHSNGESVELVVDPKTFPYLRQAKILWIDDERGRGFLVENPRQKFFRGKFFKRSGWEKRLLETQDSDKPLVSSDNEGGKN